MKCPRVETNQRGIMSAFTRAKQALQEKSTRRSRPHFDGPTRATTVERGEFDQRSKHDSCTEGERWYRESAGGKRASRAKAQRGESSVWEGECGVCAVCGASQPKPSRLIKVISLNPGGAGVALGGAERGSGNARHMRVEGGGWRGTSVRGTGGVEKSEDTRTHITLLFCLKRTSPEKPRHDIV